MHNAVASRIAPLIAVVWLGLACDSQGSAGDDGLDADSEVISTVQLTFTPSDGTAPVVASFMDPDGDGGMSGVAEPIALAVGTEYELTVRLVNDLADPPEDITQEVRAEPEDHLVLIAGDGVRGPASDSGVALVTHDYDDRESDYGDNLVGEDLPVGLSSLLTADAVGESELRVILRHLPPLNGSPQKQPGLAEEFAAGGSLPGDVDVDVRFALRVM